MLLKRWTWEEVVAADPLGEFLCRWLSPPKGAVPALTRALKTESAPAVAAVLQKYPAALIVHLCGGHGRWVIPREAMAVPQSPHYVIGEACSLGHEWKAVFLADPRARVLTKTGRPTAAVREPVEALQDWRRWLQKNYRQATKERQHGGLGLTDCDVRMPGLILLGRDGDLSQGENEYRRRIIKRDDIHIRTYDWLIRTLQGYDGNHPGSFPYRKEFSPDGSACKAQYLAVAPIPNPFGLRPESGNRKLASVPIGPEGAKRYHEFCREAIQYLFHPQLRLPETEARVQNGLKRIDIVFENRATDGFFQSVTEKHRIHCPYVVVECKNYSTDIGNPEIDQLLGRLNPRRGNLGFLLCRSVADRERVLARCRAAVNEDNKVVIVLDDEDLKALLIRRGQDDWTGFDDLLFHRLREIVFC